MIGTSHLALSLILLISTTLALFYAIRTYDEGKPHLNNKQLYFFLTYFSFFISIAIIYYTRDIKKSECLYWISEFARINSGTFYISCFNQMYYSQSTVDSFVHSRITDVHDALICLLIINACIFVIFTFLFKKIVKFYQTKKNNISFKKSDEGTLLPSNENNQDAILDDNNDNQAEPVPESSPTQQPQEQAKQPSTINSPQQSPMTNQAQQENPKEYEYEYEYEYSNA